MRVYGTCGGAEISFTQVGDRWEAAIPADPDGEYVTALYAQDEAGNTAYVATVLFAVNPETLCLSVQLLSVEAAAALRQIAALTAVRGVGAQPLEECVLADAFARKIDASVSRCALCGR